MSKQYNMCWDNKDKIKFLLGRGSDVGNGSHIQWSNKIEEAWQCPTLPNFRGTLSIIFYGEQHTDYNVKVTPRICKVMDLEPEPLKLECHISLNCLSVDIMQIRNILPL